MRTALRLHRVALVALVGGAILAASARARGDEGEMEEAVVRGQRGVSGGASGFVSSAHEGETPREITDVASLIEPMPGVHVRRLGADDGFATLSIRGTSSTQVALVLAGVPLTGGADPTVDLGSLPLWPGARARVFRSFAPAAYGRGSLGGTLVLDPPGARAETATEATLQIGSFGAARMRTSDVRAIGAGARLATGVSASRSTGDFGYVDPTANGRESTRENAGHAAANGMVSYVLPIRFAGGREGSLQVTALAQDRKQGVPGTIFSPTTAQELRTSRLLSSIEVSVPLSRDEGGSTAIDAFVRTWGRREHLSIRDDPRKASLALAPSRTDDTIAAAGGALGIRGRATRDLTVLGQVDASLERFAPGSWEGATQPAGATRATGAAGGDAELRLTRAFSLATSGRIDAWNDDSPNGDAKSFVLPTAHAGAEVVTDLIAIAAHGGRVARPPSFVERYGNRGGFLGNADLRPESAVTLDLGARHRRKYGALTIDAELVGFTTWAEDLITFVPQGAFGNLRATNIGRARLQGLESSLRLGLGPAELFGSHTFLSTANGDQCVATKLACERPPLPGRPVHDVVGDFALRFGPVRLRYGIDVVSGIVPDLQATRQVPARVLQSAGARLRVDAVPGLELAVDAKNLADVRTADYAGVLGPVKGPIGDLYEYPLPGRSFFATLRFRSGGASFAPATL